MPLGDAVPFKSTDEDDNQVYQIRFNDHFEGIGVSVDPGSVLRMQTERVEVPGQIYVSSQRCKVVSLTMPRCRRYWPWQGSQRKYR